MKSKVPTTDYKNLHVLALLYISKTTKNSSVSYSTSQLVYLLFFQQADLFPTSFVFALLCCGTLPYCPLLDTHPHLKCHFLG